MASQRFSFKYGKEQLSLSIEHARSIRVLEGAPLPRLAICPRPSCTASRTGPLAPR